MRAHSYATTHRRLGDGRAYRLCAGAAQKVLLALDRRYGGSRRSSRFPERARVKSQLRGSARGRRTRTERRPERCSTFPGTSSLRPATLPGRWDSLGSRPHRSSNEFLSIVRPPEPAPAPGFSRRPRPSAKLADGCSESFLDCSGKKTMTSFKTVFVTGGAGYIGSHCVVELLQSGYDVVAIDNFANSVSGEAGESAALARVERITGTKIPFYNCDLTDREKLEEVFNKHKIDCVIHFAAIKAVSESMQIPLHYYRNNIIGAINLLEVMKKAQCFQFVFSSSCTVYGEPDNLPITEDHPVGNITNVYGRTKYFIEEMLKDISRAEKCWNITLLRYFNPLGAHPSGLIGEDPTKAYTNLMPYIAQVALGRKPELVIFGGDYPTKDGTGIRDYIHVMDLATGHVAALDALRKNHSRLKVYNLGTGKGVSVLELVKTFEKVTGTRVPYVVKDRREGDIVSMYANAELARKELGWSARHSVERMCEDFWRWQTMNPNGYRVSTNGAAAHD